MTDILEFKPKKETKSKEKTKTIMKDENMSLHDFVTLLVKWQNWLESPEAEGYEKVILKVNIELIS
jgi:hypothetical protein